jgi:hypothetical protein
MGIREQPAERYVTAAAPRFANHDALPVCYSMIINGSPYSTG